MAGKKGLLRIVASFIQYNREFQSDKGTEVYGPVDGVEAVKLNRHQIQIRNLIGE